MDLPELTGLVALDLETEDPLLLTHGPGWPWGGGRVVGVAVAYGAEEHYLAFGHATDNTHDPDVVARWLRAQAAKPDVTWVCHHALYDRGWCSTLGVTFKGAVHDTKTAIPLLDEYRASYSLDACLHDYLGERKREDVLAAYAKQHRLHPKKDLWKFPGATVVGPYARQDAGGTLRLWNHVRPLLAAEDLWPVYQLELDLHPVLLAMRRAGIRVDVERAHVVAKELEAEEHRLQHDLNRLAGRVVNVWAADSIAEAFDAAGVGYGYTAKTKRPSFRKGWLETQTHPLAAQVMAVRKLNKLRTTFVEGYFLGHTIDGRIYPEFNPLRSDEGGAVSGRYSSSNPNFQNLPAKEEGAGKLVRGLVLAEEGEQWAACDYSQQEPRLMVHFGCVAGFPSAREMAEHYRTDPATDFHQLMSDLTGLKRSIAKNIALGRAYGMGGAKYCDQVGLPTATLERPKRDAAGRLVLKEDGTPEQVVIRIAGAEGQEQLDTFDGRMPFVKQLSDRCEQKAHRRGYIRTLLGRRCRFATPRVPGSEGRAYPYKAMNRLIQGSAADQGKQAMVTLYRTLGVVPRVTVHDELGVSVPDAEAAAEVARVMETCVPLRVPSKVDVGLGASWGEAL